MRFLPATGFAALLAACTAPQYDDQTDKLITTLQTDADTQFVSLLSLRREIVFLSGRTDAASVKALADARAKLGYAANMPAYDKIDVDLTSLELRIAAAPNDTTPHIEKALADLRANLVGDASLMTVHQQSDAPSAGYLAAQHALVDQELKALLTYDLVLKSGGAATGAK